MKYNNSDFNKWESALPVYQETELQSNGYGKIPDVNTGLLGPEKQAAVSAVAGVKEAIGYGDIVRKNETAPPSFKDILVPVKKTLGMGLNLITGTLRVGAEAAVGVAQDFDKLTDPNASQEYQTLQVKDPILKFMLGTDEITPLGKQVEGLVDSSQGKTLHEKALATGLFAVGKGLEASGAAFPGVGPLADARIGVGKLSVPGIRPAAQAVLRRTFGQSVSPVISWAGGAEKFAALAEHVSPLTGKSADQLAAGLEVWARKVALEDIDPRLTPDNVGVEAYNKALFEKVSDEQALLKMQSFAHGGTIEEQLVNMDKAVSADLSTLSIKGRGPVDLIESAKAVAKDTATAAETEARQFAKETVAQMKKDKTISAQTDSLLLEDRFYQQRLKELQSSLTKTPESPEVFSAKDIEKPPENFNPIPVKVIDPAKRAAAGEWVDKNATANTHVNDEFFNQFPEYRPYADQLYKASDYNRTAGTINPTKFQEAVKNVEERFTYHFKPGTQGAADALAAKEQGYLVGQAPTAFKGGEVKTYTARVSEDVPFEIRNNPMSPVGRFLSASGLSPVGIEKGTIAQAQVQKFQEYLSGFRSKDIDVEGSYTALRKLASSKMAISESKFGMAHRAEGIFSLSVEDIERGLDVSRDVAKVYRSAIQQSRRVPVAVQGLGPAAVNAMRSMPVIGPVMNTALYLTNLGHFTISPAHATRYVTKSSLFSLGEGAGANLGVVGRAIRKISPDIKLPNLWGGEGYNLPTLKSMIGEEANPKTLLMIEDAFYSKKGLEALDVVNDSDLTSTAAFKGAGKTRNHNLFLEGIRYDERQTTANIFYSIGKRNGLKGNIDEVVARVMGDEKLLAQASDVAEGIVGYKSGYLQSPLAKTLNIMWYPSRFDTKVAQLTSNFIGRQNPIVQKSIIQGTMNMVEWSQSEGGKQWIKDNDAVVKLVNNLIPYGSIAEMIGHASKGEFTDLGLIGGLPFGFVQSILTQEGVIKNTYVNPATNRSGVQTIPTSLSEGAAMAVSGLFRHFFPLPIYTFSLQKIRNPIPTWVEDTVKSSLGQQKYPYGAPTPYNRPRPEQLFPVNEADSASDKAWKYLLQSLLSEKVDSKNKP